MENQHKLIKGYSDVSQEQIDLLNEGKELALTVRAYTERVRASEAIPDGCDPRWLATGLTDLQTGFMKVFRSIMKPEGF